jgi:hypothetical protein
MRLFPDDEFVIFYQSCEEIDNTPISRQVYITSANDVTITHGLILIVREPLAMLFP